MFHVKHGSESGVIQEEPLISGIRLALGWIMFHVKPERSFGVHVSRETSILDGMAKTELNIWGGALSHRTSGRKEIHGGRQHNEGFCCCESEGWRR